MDQDTQASNALKHLARLSDFIFALAMALTFWQFDLPENAETLTKLEINQFLVGQLKPLGTYLITFVLVAVYWIAHTQQFSYYKRTNETHLWIYTLYLMCLFLVPYSNELTLVFSDNSIAKICFAVNIALIGFLSFISWNYATHQHRLVDESLDSVAIAAMKVKALIEPTCALIAEVYQSDIGKIRKGQTAIITGESFTGELQGTVHEIGLEVSRQQVFSNQPGENLDQRVVKVRIRLTPEDSQRVAGLTNLQVQVVIQP